MLAQRSLWFKLWLAAAVAVWAFDAFLVYRAVVEMPRSNASMTREDVCWWAEERYINSFPIEREPGENIEAACLTRQDVYLATLEQRDLVVERFRIRAAAIIGTIALIPLVFGAVFVGLKIGFLAIYHLARKHIGRWRRRDLVRRRSATIRFRS